MEAIKITSKKCCQIPEAPLRDITSISREPQLATFYHQTNSANSFDYKGSAHRLLRAPFTLSNTETPCTMEKRSAPSDGRQRRYHHTVPTTSTPPADTSSHSRTEAESIVGSTTTPPLSLPAATVDQPRGCSRGGWKRRSGVGVIDRSARRRGLFTRGRIDHRAKALSSPSFPFVHSFTRFTHRGHSPFPLPPCAPGGARRPADFGLAACVSRIGQRRPATRTNGSEGRVINAANIPPDLSPGFDTRRECLRAPATTGRVISTGADVNCVGGQDRFHDSDRLPLAGGAFLPPQAQEYRLALGTGNARLVAFGNLRGGL